ncbi:uncharacterized protein LOC119103464 [Pollicipes pollicipes]|uniref:uncharacterized protein LOC119103464 n=1 Tax=Pollicipes pollicipes TaxID=41117 RepID=UPI001884F99D|nr:uncharacterized protein LOC119103464 [Pollicipes pollicipes]
MDPEYARELWMYEKERERERMKKEALEAVLVDISDGALSRSSVEATEKESKKAEEMSELGLRILDRLKALRQKHIEGDGPNGSATKAEHKTDEHPTEPQTSRSTGGELYSSYLNLNSKTPVMALHEYCAARQWKAPVFHITETPGDKKQQHFYRGAVRVNGKMNTANEPMRSKKEAKHEAALVCLQRLGLRSAHPTRQQEQSDTEERVSVISLP